MLHEAHEAIEQQTNDKNGPRDKPSGVDHVIDTAAHAFAYMCSIVKKVAAVEQILL